MGHFGALQVAVIRWVNCGSPVVGSVPIMTLGLSLVETRIVSIEDLDFDCVSVSM